MQDYFLQEEMRVQKQRRIATLALLAGVGMLCAGLGIAQLTVASETTPPADEMIIILDHIEFTSLGSDARSQAAYDYRAAREQLASALGQDDATALRDNATYFSLLESTGTVFLEAERASAEAALTAVTGAAVPPPHAEEQAAYESARLAYIDHLLSTR